MSTSGVTVANKPVAGLRGMPVGAQGRANLNVNFAGWYVRFNPTYYPASTQISITRNSEQTWIIEACGPPSTWAQKAELIALSNGGKTQTDEGLFYMPTVITIQCPTC